MKINSIQVKIVSLIVLVLLISTVVSIYFTVNNQRENLLEASERTLSLNTEMLNLTIRNIMLSGEAPIAVRMMSSLQKIEEFLELAIYRIDGNIAFNDYRTTDSVNRYQNKYRFARTPRVELKVINNENFRQALESNTPVQVESTETRELEYYFPILNYSECRECHGETEFVRGIAHFKISVAGIYDQIRMARNILTIIFILLGVGIAGLLIFSVHRIIISPALTIGRTAKIVGEGNLDTRITLRSKDELGDLGNTLNEMIEGLKERSELIVENRVIEARNTENRKYLDTIQEGLLLLDKNYVISEQYSHYLVQLFETEDIAGKNLIDFVFPNEETQTEDRKELAQFLDILFKNTISDMEMIMQINPLQNRTLQIRHNGHIKEIIIDALFHRILENDTVENIMVIFADKTEIARVQKELKIERVRSETEIEHIAAILRAGPQSFVDFIDQANDALNDVELDLDHLGNPETINKLFRKMHSLKGTARYLEFRHAETLAHEIENLMAKVRDEKQQADEAMKSQIKSIIADMQNELENIKKLNERFRRFADIRLESKEQSDRTQLLNFVRGLKKMTEDIAREMDKEISFKAFGSPEDISILNKLRDPIIHMIRNAIDHGIEDKMERLASGKSTPGQIKLSFSKVKDRYRIELSDDGRGIDFEMVRKRAIQRKLLSDKETGVPKAKLLQIIFSPSFSSGEGVSDISGRGVGLDVVQDVVRGLKGKISVRTQEKKGTRFILEIPV